MLSSADHLQRGVGVGQPVELEIAVGDVGQQVARQEIVVLVVIDQQDSHRVVTHQGLLDCRREARRFRASISPAFGRPQSRRRT